MGFLQKEVYEKWTKNVRDKLRKQILFYKFAENYKTQQI